MKSISILFWISSSRCVVWPYFLPKKRTNCTYSHHTPNHQTPICRARLHDVQRWNLRSSETFYFAQVRTLEYVLAYQRTVCEKHAGILGRHLWGSCNSCKKRQCLLLYIYIYITELEIPLGSKYLQCKECIICTSFYRFLKSHLFVSKFHHHKPLQLDDRCETNQRRRERALSDHET